jgi:hypothetical protein
MTDKPILFSAPMVRALLDGRKTQTRRALKPPYGTLEYLGSGEWKPICTKFLRGDRLWVRESFITGFDIDDEMSRPVGERKVWYRATDQGLTWFDPDTETTLDNPPWKPSIHMPRRASRLTLTVTDVRVQRLHEISEADAVAEGVEPIRCEWWQGFVRHADGSRSMMEAFGADGPPPADFEHPEKQVLERSARDEFRNLWNSLHDPDAWDANPWVCAISFDVHRCNIDQLPTPSRGADCDAAGATRPADGGTLGRAG